MRVCRPLREEGSVVRRGPLAYVVAFAGGGAKDVTARSALMPLLCLLTSTLLAGHQQSCPSTAAHLTATCQWIFTGGQHACSRWSQLIRAAGTAAAQLLVAQSTATEARHSAACTASTAASPATPLRADKAAVAGTWETAKAAEKHRDATRWLRFLEPYRRKEASFHGSHRAAGGVQPQHGGRGKQPSRRAVHMHSVTV